MNTILVRKMMPDDITYVLALFESVFLETFSSPAPVFEEVTEGETIYIALMDHCIVGMASVWEPDRFVHYLLVDPKKRNQRVGRSLVGYLAERYGTLTLKCLVANKNAMAFYRATGWQEVETGHCEEGEYALFRLKP